MKRLLTILLPTLLAATAWAKLPPAPAPTDADKAKAAEAAARTAHGNLVANFQLCRSMEKTAAHYFKTAKSAGKDVKPATATAPCADPGAFVYPPPAPGSAPVAAAAAPAPAGAKPVPAKPAAAPAKKS